jgi:hypothetical protein
MISRPFGPTIEEVAPASFEGLGYSTYNALEVAPSEFAAGPTTHGEPIPTRRFQGAPARLRPQPQAEALDDAFPKATIPQAPSPLASNRTLHRMFIGGIPACSFRSRSRSCWMPLFS